MATAVENVDSVDARRKNFLDVGQTKNINGRVSVSEPLAVPHGHKIIATAMEIGIIRDVVDRAIMFHESATGESNNIWGKAYNACFSSAYKTVILTDSVVKSTDKIYQDTFPGFIVNRTNATQTLIWTKWVAVDETVSTSVSHQLVKHPFFRKSTSDVLKDIKITILKSLEITKIWKFGENILEVLVHLAEKFKPGKSSENNDNTDPDDLDVQDSGSVAATPNESEQKIRVRGLTAGACGYIDQAPAADKAEGQ